MERADRWPLLGRNLLFTPERRDLHYPRSEWDTSHDTAEGQLEAAGLESGDSIVVLPRQDDSETLFEVVRPPSGVDLSQPPETFEKLLGGGGVEELTTQSD